MLGSTQEIIEKQALRENGLLGHGLWANNCSICTSACSSAMVSSMHKADDDKARDSVMKQIMAQTDPGKEV